VPWQHESLHGGVSENGRAGGSPETSMPREPNAAAGRLGMPAAWLAYLPIGSSGVD
jgi:hypothetical protein